MSCCNACARGESCSCDRPSPDPNLCSGYGSVGKNVIGGAKTVEGGATGIAGGGGVGVIALAFPAGWRAVCGKDGYRGIRLNYTLNTAGGAVTESQVVITTSVSVFDGAGTLIRTDVVGEITAKTLASLLCGNTALAQPDCFLYPWPDYEGAPLCVGGQQYEQFNINIVNGGAAGSLVDVNAIVDLENCCATDAGPTGAPTF